MKTLVLALGSFALFGALLFKVLDIVNTFVASLPQIAR